MNKQIKIIEVVEISLSIKDMIEIKNKEDFLYLCGEAVFEKDNFLYSISDSVVYYIKVHEDEVVR